MGNQDQRAPCGRARVGRRIDVRTIAAFREPVEEDPAPQTPAQCIDTLQLFLIGRNRDERRWIGSRAVQSVPGGA